MANQLGPNPLVLDTASTSAVLIDHRIFVETIMFSEYANDADDFIVHDRNGKIVAQGDGQADLSPVIISVDGWINGLILHTLDAGLITVYFK